MDSKADSKKTVKRLDTHSKGNFKKQNQKSKGSNTNHSKGKKK